MKRSTTPLGDQLAQLTSQLADLKTRQRTATRQQQRHTDDLDTARRELIDLRARALTTPGDEAAAARLAARVHELETQSKRPDDGPIYDRAVQLGTNEVATFATINADALLAELQAQEQATVARLAAAVSEARAVLAEHSRINTAANRVYGLADGRTPVDEIAPYNPSNALRALDELADAPRPLRRVTPDVMTIPPTDDPDDEIREQARAAYRAKATT